MPITKKELRESLKSTTKNVYTVDFGKMVVHQDRPDIRKILEDIENGEVLPEPKSSFHIEKPADVTPPIERKNIRMFKLGGGAQVRLLAGSPYDVEADMLVFGVDKQLWGPYKREIGDAMKNLPDLKKISGELIKNIPTPPHMKVKRVFVAENLLENEYTDEIDRQTYVRDVVQAAMIEAEADRYTSVVFQPLHTKSDDMIQRDEKLRFLVDGITTGLKKHPLIEKAGILFRDELDLDTGERLLQQELGGR